MQIAVNTGANQHTYTNERAHFKTLNVFDVFPASSCLITRSGLISSRHFLPPGVPGCTGAPWTRAGAASTRAG